LVSVAAWLLSLTVAAGAVLALWHLRATEATSLPPFGAGIAHGILGGAGLVVLLLALRGPPRGVDAGAGSFGALSAGLLACAAVTGLVMLMLRRKSVVMTVHAGFAVSGYVLLLAWDALG
jgi:hypothetical protein